MSERRKIVAGNWKMHTSMQEAHELFHAIGDSYDQLLLSEKRQVVLAPPFIYLEQMSGWAEEYPYLSVAAQNCHQEEKGAFTGEISAWMLSSIGVEYVIIGHSERRSYFNEDAILLAQKTNAALKNGLTPIFCCGETLDIRDAGQQESYVAAQLKESLWHLGKTTFEQIVIAYEPVWAIGTGKTATPEQAQEMHAFIRSLMAEKYGYDTAGNTTILYGGSCNAGNATLLFSQPDVDGGLVGGASLKAKEFIQIIQALP
jgi:triosephosphate isomerase